MSELKASVLLLFIRFSNINNQKGSMGINEIRDALKSCFNMVANLSTMIEVVNSLEKEGRIKLLAQEDLFYDYEKENAGERRWRLIEGQ